MTNEEYINGHLCYDCNDKDTCSETCYWYNHMKHVAEWKDEQFAAEKQALIDKACDLYNSDLQQFQNLLGKIRKNAKGLIDIDSSLSDFRKAIEGTK